MSRLVRFHEFGGPEVLRLEEQATPHPGAGEVRLRIQAIGLNRAEAAFRSGHYIEQARLPSRLGYEAVGVIEALGAGVEGWEVGRSVCVVPVFSMNDYGVYAEQAIVPVSSLALRPPGLGNGEAASVWMAYFTAYGALIDIAQLRAGEAAVITAASSSVGVAAIQIARRAGAVAIAVTRTAAKRDALLAAGAQHVVVTDEEDVAAAVARITAGKGARVVFDPIAGPGAAALALALAPQGILILYGNLSGKAGETPFPFGVAAGRGLSMRGYLVFEILRDPARRAKAEAYIRAGLADGALQPRVDRVFGFDQIVAAHRYLEANQQLGKVVVSVSE